MDEALQALGAFLSGVGAVLGAFWALKRMRATMERECRERLELFREGIELGREEREN